MFEQFLDIFVQEKNYPEQLMFNYTIINVKRKIFEQFLKIFVQEKNYPEQLMSNYTAINVRKKKYYGN